MTHKDTHTYKDAHTHTRTHTYTYTLTGFRTNRQACIVNGTGSFVDIWGSFVEKQSFFVDTPQKASWNKAGVEPAFDTTGIDRGLLKISFLVLVQNAGFVRDNGTNYTKEGHRGRKPVSEKLLGWYRAFLWICRAFLWIHRAFLLMYRSLLRA